jgi:DNA-directed RNA polymerase specialized sigma24 family protein
MDKQEALRAAARAVIRADAAERAKTDAILAAHELGASLRDIAAATGVPTMTVKRIIDRDIVKTRTLST